MGQAVAWPFFVWVSAVPPRAFHPNARSHDPITEFMEQTTEFFFGRRTIVQKQKSKAMNITIDTSVLLAVCTNDPSKPRLIELTQGHHLLAPASVHWEVGNALSSMLKRGRITGVQAKACILMYQQIPLTKIEVDLAAAVALAEQFQMYAYDAYLLTCALAQRTPLLTLDRGLMAAAKKLNIELPGD